MAAKVNGSKATRDDAADAVQLVVDYVKQETLGPLRGIARFVLAGAVAAILWSVGLVMLALGLLRILQTETGSAFTEHLSWLPYVLTMMPVVGVAAVAAVQITRGPAERRRRRR